METNINEPLKFGVDTQTLDTARPVLPNGPYAFRVEKVEILDNKAGTGRNLKVEFATSDSVTTDKGVVLPPGAFKVFKYYPMQAPDADPAGQMWIKSLVLLQDACLGTTKDNRPADYIPSDFVGKEVLVNLKSIDDPAFGMGNEITSVKALPRT